MTSTKTLSKLLLVALTTSLFSACGGSGGSSGGPGGPNGASGRTFRGEITSLTGGLTVNGVRFAAAGAVLALPDEATSTRTLASDAELATHLVTGMVVTVKGRAGEDGRGEAGEIEFEHAVEGEIEVHGPGHVDVLGEHVSIDDDTNVVDRHGGKLSKDDLSTGTRVEVSGHGDGRGGLRATMIRVRDDRAGEDAEVKAWVVAVSGATVDLSFTRGGQVAFQLDVSGVTPAPVLAVGDLVEVKTNGARNAAGALIALSVKHEDEPGHEGEHEVEGIVTALTASGFVVGDVTVSVSDATRFEGGTRDDVVVGAKVEAEGTMGADGVLAAEKVELKPAMRIEANVDAIDATAGTFTVLGLTVSVTPSTEGLSLAGLSVGQNVEVRGSLSRDGLAVIATRLELKDAEPADRAFLRGLVTAKTASTITIAGIEVNLSGGEFRNLQDGAMTMDAFLAAVTPGQTVVKVRWRPYPTSTADAIDEAELEN